VPPKEKKVFFAIETKILFKKYPTSVRKTQWGKSPFNKW
jgi:hypothetical protein